MSYEYETPPAMHTYEKHTHYSECYPREGSCTICDGGLSICTVCGLLEGALTTECPGVPSYKEHADAVYAGKEDFINGEWRTKL